MGLEAAPERWTRGIARGWRRAAPATLSAAPCFCCGPARVLCASPAKFRCIAAALALIWPRVGRGSPPPAPGHEELQGGKKEKKKKRKKKKRKKKTKRQK
jgi:hypothetical protein